MIDHWYKTKGTPFQRVYPDLYHKYVGHDDNRDWFMFTQKETRMNVEMVQNKYKPIITHDMHQQGGNGARIFVPPFTEPFDPNMHPLLRMEQAHGRPGDGEGADCRKARKGVAWEDALRHVVAGAPVHGLSRPAAHPHRDCQQQSRRSLVKSRERQAARLAGFARALPGAVHEGHVDAWTAGGLRRDRRVCRHDRSREVRPRAG